MHSMILRNTLLLSSILWLFSFSNCNSGNTELINGTYAPAINLPDTSGKEITLEQLKGKIVLIDFWASWCKPCRKVNPKLVQLHKKYRDTEFENAEGFEILSVSLDSDRKKWIAAIEKDKLYWPWHVSELKGWQSKVALDYKLESIPASFLIDQKGMIIGVDLRLRDLESILQKRLKNNNLP
ncbi:MAG: TlpA disulfide reductase family protein [Chitinophagales bacterium]